MSKAYIPRSERANTRSRISSSGSSTSERSVATIQQGPEILRPHIKEGHKVTAAIQPLSGNIINSNKSKTTIEVCYKSINYVYIYFNINIYIYIYILCILRVFDFKV